MGVAVEYSLDFGCEMIPSFLSYKLLHYDQCQGPDIAHSIRLACQEIFLVCLGACKKLEWSSIYQINW